MESPQGRLLLQRERERWLDQPWHLVVLDEAQNIKNASTHAAQVVAELNTRHRLCLSGTPIEEPGDSGRLTQLRSRITPFMLRRTKDEVATELPDKIESVSSIELSGKQADLYETIRLSTEKAVRDALDNQGLARSQIQILDALLKLRQVCCDPRLVPLASAKLEHLMTVLPQMLAEGRRHGAEPAAGRHGDSLRSVVEPGGPRPGDEPRLPHRAKKSGLCLQAGGAGHD